MNVRCPNCQTTLRAPDDSAGKRLKCPGCGNIFAIAGGSSASASSSAVTGSMTPAAGGNPPSLPQQPTTPQAGQAQWRVQTGSGQQYGPIAREQLDSWVAEGRIARDSQVYCDGWQAWKWASEVFPSLGQQTAGGHNSGAQQSAQSDNPFAIVGDSRRSPSSIGKRAPATDSQGPLEVGWHAVVIGFRIASVALLISSIGLGLLMVAMLVLSSGEFSQFLLNVMIWGGFSTFGAFFSLLTGQFVCLAVPYRSQAKGLAMGAVVCMCIAIGLLVVVAPGLATMFAGRRGDFQSTVSLLEAVKWLTLLSSAAGMSMFALLAAKVAAHFGDRGLKGLASGYVIFEGVWLLWFVLLDVAIERKSSDTGILIMLVTFLLGIGSHVFLLGIVHRSRGRLQREIARQ